jgi:hypothetical protein
MSLYRTEWRERGYELNLVGGGGGGGNSDAASYKISRICVYRSKHELKKVTFSTNKMQNFFKTIGAFTESTDLIIRTFQKIIHLVTLYL